MGKSETRKLQQTGGSSFIVSLPKPWVVQNGLGPKDQVKIEWRPNGSLRIIAEEASVRRRSEIEIDLDNTNDSFLLEYLIGAYLSGAQLIRLRTKTHVDKDVRKILRRFIQTTRGVEIISESEKTIELITMLNPQD
ncbi:MAG: AbrB/MazE/SpoVT family DNA-binding domain-containing protein, partial [Candidatus Thalassarchaeaceae archaeon]